MIGRIDPTPDDLAIHSRTVRRLLRWMRAREVLTGRSTSPAQACDITRRAMLDAMEFPPVAKGQH